MQNTTEWVAAVESRLVLGIGVVCFLRDVRMSVPNSLYIYARIVNLWTVGHSQTSRRLRFGMFLQIRFYKRTHGDNFELVEMGIIKRGADKLTSQALTLQGFRYFGMDQANVLVGASVL